VWVRPLSMWTETVTRNGVTRPRFEYIGENAPAEALSTDEKCFPGGDT
ncbi:MAG: DUF1653 domain-containing protein, partial [Clostridia bacterium]|nr:DUF1653 domain-containing protein [Clostridia bacterium]